MIFQIIISTDNSGNVSLPPITILTNAVRSVLLLTRTYQIKPMTLACGHGVWEVERPGEQVFVTLRAAAASLVALRSLLRFYDGRVQAAHITQL